MRKKDLLKKQQLAEELGMNFEEAAELFSEETLETMKLQNFNGGTEGVIDGLCSNGACPTFNVVCDKCFCTTPTTTTPPPLIPPKFTGEGCVSDTTFPPPPTVAQDAICYPTTTTTKPKI